jgi:radical SAM superfamily enzyme YgiQ (UPF0313 family)
MVELCDHLDRAQSACPTIANLTFKDRNGTLHRNAPRPLMTGRQLDELPFADRSLFDHDKISDPDRPILMASRGCPYDCSYCCNRALLEVLGRRPAARIRGVKNVMREINQVRNAFPRIDGIHFDDDIFGMKLSWLREFAHRYRSEVALPFSCNMRPTLASEEAVQLLAAAGCDEVAMGVETGNPGLRERLLRRRMDDQLLIDAFERFERAGISAHSFNMVGLPHETMQNSLETIKLNAALKKSWRMRELRVSIFYPYAGTALNEEARKHAMLTGRNVTYYADDTVLNLQSMTGDQIRFVARYFRPLVVLYQKLLRELGKPGRAAVRLLDRFLLSTPASRWLFPLANSVYPWAVKIARWCRASVKGSRPRARGGRSGVIKSLPSGSVLPRLRRLRRDSGSMSRGSCCCRRPQDAHESAARR